MPKIAEVTTIELQRSGQLEKIDSPWRQVGKRFVRNRLAVFGAVVLLVLCAVALLAPYIAPYKYDAVDLFNIKAAPTAQHLMGTDELGRDVLTRLLYGSRVSLSVGIGSTMIFIILGMVVGAVAAFYGKWIDNALMRFVDIMLSFPSMLLLIILASYTRGMNVIGMVIIIGLTSWMGISRLVRGSILSLKEQDFTDAARALGAKDARIIFKHLIPNALGPIFVSATLGVGGAIMYESALSYLGIGIVPPAASWGNMLSNAQDYLSDAWWLAFYPGLMIFLTVLCINFVGDGLRDAFDPKMRK